METLLWIGLGGFVGANARYLVSNWAVENLAARFSLGAPIGTLLVNVVGSFILGALFMLVESFVARGAQFPANVRLLIGTGFCGAFTTFSTYAVETVVLARSGEWGGAVVNLLANNALCLVAVLAGMALVGRVMGT
jgi:CrcB protein